MSDGNNNNLLEAYKLLCSSYHAIDDFRAKLLGFLPLATGSGLFLLSDKLTQAGNLGTQAKDFLAVAGAFGLLVTAGLFTYEIYGIKKCAALLRAGRRMERLLGLNDGQFGQRPQNVARVVNEPFAAGIIYPAVLAMWAFFTLTFAYPKANPWIPLSLFLAGLAGTLTYDFLLRRTA